MQGDPRSRIPQVLSAHLTSLLGAGCSYDGGLPRGSRSFHHIPMSLLLRGERSRQTGSVVSELGLGTSQWAGGGDSGVTELQEVGYEMGRPWRAEP